ncbi:MAG: heme exporter protein CcmD [endosymbiont of Galathealinum brachiosum]|uniref:Heme exporter protein D n=1 Tax=endosymbiont of Galathealinum brachiosum TaxID=2200906 RepID=A0A370D888_9GAMM|nr:MAG: heme exporter protein CcmD [endosymbiont of Galathealinum brachiosum]
MSPSEFFHMGGYAVYVWSSYGLALVVLGWILISPVFTKKSIIKELKIKYRQQERQRQEDT